MKYKNIIKAKFVLRMNRFMAICIADGQETEVHVKNTGRCKELLLPGAEVYLQRCDSEKRKTKYDLISVIKGNNIINMDSQCPNKVAYEWLAQGNYLDAPIYIKPEIKYGESRLDFYLENQTEKAYVEVKGVTLESNGTAIFPDAPTARGARHLSELIKAAGSGYRAAVLFIVQMKGCRCFTPNDLTDKHFSDELRRCAKSGVDIIAVDSIVTVDSVTADKRIEVKL